MDKEIMDFIAADWRLDSLVANMPQEYMDYIVELIDPPFEVVRDADMMQGDAYGIRIKILSESGTSITPSDVSEVEVTIGSLIKTYGSGDVTYDSTIDAWIFPLTQDETFKFRAARAKAQVRIVLNNGNIHGIPLGYINVDESISKEVL